MNGVMGEEKINTKRGKNKRIQGDVLVQGAEQGGEGRPEAAGACLKAAVGNHGSD